MIDLRLAQELMTDFASEVYEIVEGSHPKFLVEEWKDKIELSRLTLDGRTTTQDDVFVAQWATLEGLSVENFINKTLEEQAKYIGMRQALANLYKSSLHAAMTSTPEALPATFGGIVQNATGAMKLFANGDEVMEARLMETLGTMVKALNEATQ